jgi:pyrroline-5-carboxylate reductase
MKVLVLGAGKMVEAFLLGMKKTENLSEWFIYSPSGVSAKRVAQKVGAKSISDLSEMKNLDWILLGCKPQHLHELKEILGDRFTHSLYISLLAAISEEQQLEILQATQLIRAMPNLAVESHEGVVFLSSQSSFEKLSIFQHHFSQLGMALIVKEEELDELTLLTGSGPGLFYTFANELAASFVSLDGPRRELLVKQVIKGCASSFDSNQSLSQMTDAVTSKAGVTIAVINEWKKNHLWLLMKEGLLAGQKRMIEIRDQLRK